MQKKVFITGGTGFLGRAVVELLAKTGGYYLMVLTRKKIKSNDNNIKFVIGDILEKNSFQRYTREADIILHMAAISIGDDKTIWNVNVNGTKNIIELCKNKKLIFISSENVLYNNQSIYGESKKICENLVKNIKDHLILRITVAYGKHDKARLGRIINWCRDWPVIFIPGNGKSLMQPIFVNDVAGFILNAIEKDKKGTFLLAGNSMISLNEFINQVGLILNKKIIMVHIPLFLLFPLVKINEILLKNPFVRWSQLRNLNTKRVYNIIKTIEEFDYTPHTIKESFQRILLDDE